MDTVAKLNLLFNSGQFGLLLLLFLLFLFLPHLCRLLFLPLSLPLLPLSLLLSSPIVLPPPPPYLPSDAVNSSLPCPN